MVPTDLSEPFPQLFNLVRFGHKCFSSSRSYHKNAWFRERLQDYAISCLFSTPDHPIYLQLGYIILLHCPLLIEEEEMWTEIENLRCHTSKSGKHSQWWLFAAHPQKPWMVISKGYSNIYSSIHLLCNQGNSVHEFKLYTGIRWRGEQAGTLQELIGSYL